ncbi:PIN domain-containing protein [Salinarchaeum laminariae]|uniref:PIN domain-containing protein n=1 Tax=Salinarchaeum laminariae TaxID=869888 RepID=UPI0020BE7E11|nr:PIN domain-containing protein [Salinarchaeum laminariae]
MYADLSVWLALFTEDESRANRAASLLAEHEDDLQVSLVTFVELFLIEESYPFDRERAVTAMLDLAEFDDDPAVLYRASRYREQGRPTFEAFHAAIADERGIPGATGDSGAETTWLQLDQTMD